MSRKYRQLLLWPLSADQPYYEPMRDRDAEQAYLSERERLLEEAAFSADKLSWLGWLITGRFNLLLDKLWGWRIYGASFTETPRGRMIVLRGGSGYSDKRVAFFTDTSFEAALCQVVKAVRSGRVNWRVD